MHSSINASDAVEHEQNSTTVRFITSLSTAAPARASRASAPLSLRAVRGGMQALSRLSPEAAAAVAEHLFLTPRRRPRPPSEVDLLAPARRLSLRTRRGEVAAWQWGSPAAPPVLLVHGWEGRGAQLGGFVTPLLARGLSAITFDAPAHGDSEGRRSSIVHFADAVESAAEAFGPLQAIVAHSMGAPATLWASREGALARRLVLVAPPIDVRDFTRAMARTLGVPDDVRERVHRRLHAHLGVPVESLRADRIAARLRGPLLVVHDEEDREVPVACGEAIARAWPAAEILRTRGLGHHRILRDAAIQARVADFVAHDLPRASAAEGA